MKFPDNFPLSWPEGYPVTEYREPSKFNCTFAEARDGVLTELNRLGVSECLISTNLQRNKRGDLVAGRLIYDNPGVAVYFYFKGELKVIACDKWKYIHENLRAVEKSIDAIRGLERWGCSDIISRVTGDMKALPKNAGMSNGAWWQVLGVNQDAPLDYITRRYKRLAKELHPDMPTGDEEKFKQLQLAYDTAVASKGRENNG